MAGRDYVVIGPAPADEECAQIGEVGYERRARRECKRFIDLLRETCGPEPSGAYLSTKGFPHEFGEYYEVVCYFNERVSESIEYAYRLERDAPTNWGADAAGGAGVRCPECGGELEDGEAFMMSVGIPIEASLCSACRKIFADDGTFIADYVG